MGGIKEMIKHNVNGILVPPRDVRSLRAALSSIIDNEELAVQLGLAARDSVKDFYWPNIINKFNLLYNAA